MKKKFINHAMDSVYEGMNLGCIFAFLFGLYILVKVIASYF